jgi:ribosomal protein S27AE
MEGSIERVANRPCPECGGQRVIATSEDRHSVFIKTGILFSTEAVPVSCTNCGYTTFYTEDPSKVRKHYLKK